MPHPGETLAAGTGVPLRRSVVALALTLAGVALSISLYVYAAGWERANIANDLRIRAGERMGVVRSEVLRSMEVLQGVRSLFATDSNVTRDGFKRFVQSALARQPELHALAWTPLVHGNDRTAYEEAARRDGMPKFSFTVRNGSNGLLPAPPSSTYFPVYYIEPSARNRGALGYDLGSSRTRRQTLEAAARRRQPTATPALQLVQDNSQSLGFVVYLPVFKTDQSPEPIGYCSAVFGIADLLRSSFVDLSADTAELTITDQSDGGRTLLHRPAVAELAEFSGTAILDIAGRKWQIILRPTRRFISAHYPAHSLWILVAGLGFTLLVSGYAGRGLRQRAAVERCVRERTLQLSRQVLERRRAEGAARAAEAQYRDMFENSVQAIFQTSLDGRYLRANLALAQVYGYATPGELIDRLADIAGQLYVLPQRRREFIDLIQRHGVVSDFESQVRRKDGSIIWISENARSVRDPEGNTLYYEGVVVDVTARKEAEQSIDRHHRELEQRVRERTVELARSNGALQSEIIVRKRAEQAADTANQAKTDFLASMSHEIRTPMNAILGHAQLLCRDPLLTDERRDSIETIMQSGRHLIDLIDDVLDISKIEAGCAEVRTNELDLRALAIGVGSMFRQKCEQKGIALKIECQPDLPCRVRGDERKLRQVLINLVGNAVKFTREGDVRLRIALGEPTAGTAPGYRFEICDTGEGISHAEQEQIFEPFQQGPAGLRFGGTGLGLAITKRLIELMGGHLLLASAPLRGSCFYFRLPLEPAKIPSQRAATTPPPRALSTAPLRAIVVDDVTENRHVLALMLEELGCQVATAGGGAEAVEMLDASPADVVFLDIVMPEPDGFKTAVQIRERLGNRIRLIMTSATALANERERSIEAGFDDVLTKPVRLERLEEILRPLGCQSLTTESMATCSYDEVPGGFEAVGLPPALRQRLLEAAEIYSVTELRKDIDELERLDPSNSRLAAELRNRVRNCDMDGVVRLVAGCGVSQAVPESAA